MAKIGYARVSTEDQKLDRQILLLKEHNVDIIFKEKRSGKNIARPALKEMLNYIESGDEIYVYSIDRLGRNSNDIKKIMLYIKEHNATIKIIDLPNFSGIKDESLRSLLNNLMIELFTYIAENERKMIFQRQKQGINIAKKKGVYKGRKPKYTSDNKKLQKAIELLKNRENNHYTVDDISKITNISRSTIYRKRKLF